MASDATPQSTNSKRFSRREMVGWGVGIGLGILGLLGVQEIFNDDEERPPIIVGNGSVLIGIQEPDKDTDLRGTWERVPDSAEWHHAVTGKKVTKSLRAAVYFSNTAGCSKPRKTSSVTITYAYGADDQGNELTNVVRIYVQAGGGLRLDPGDASVDEGDRTLLTITRNGAGQLRSVAFDSGDPCTFTPGSGLVRLQQKKTQ